MNAVLMTGFPGFLGSALLPKILARREGAVAVCVVQARHMGEAKAKLAVIEAAHPHIADRVELVEGDITVPGLGVADSGTRDTARRTADERPAPRAWR